MSREACMLWTGECRSTEFHVCGPQCRSGSDRGDQLRYKASGPLVGGLPAVDDHTRGRPADGGLYRRHGRTGSLPHVAGRRPLSGACAQALEIWRDRLRSISKCGPIREQYRHFADMGEVWARRLLSVPKRTWAASFSMNSRPRRCES